MGRREDSIKQLDILLAEYERLAALSKYDDLSDLKMESGRLAARLQAAFDRITHPTDSYGKAAEQQRNDPNHLKVVELSFLAYGLREDLKAGWTSDFTELVHAETTSDMVEMAENLIASGYKDASAVICGTALELHIRALCAKYLIGLTDNNGKTKKADTLRADLKKASIISALQDKRMVYWLGLRNDAAHGHYANYSKDDVAGLINEVRNFIMSTPA